MIGKLVLLTYHKKLYYKAMLGGAEPFMFKNIPWKWNSRNDISLFFYRETTLYWSHNINTKSLSDWHRSRKWNKALARYITRPCQDMCRLITRTLSMSTRCRCKTHQQLLDIGNCNIPSFNQINKEREVSNTQISQQIKTFPMHIVLHIVLCIVCFSLMLLP
jgi:hypothetical protein